MQLMSEITEWFATTDHQSSIEIVSHSLAPSHSLVELHCDPTFLDSIDVRALSIALRPSLPRTIGFAFDEQPQKLGAFEAKSTRSDKPPYTKSSNEPITHEPKPIVSDAESEPNRPAKTLTRLRPPRDLVRLEDRLFFVLQPPLETLIQSANLSFPFQPFPYQYEGVAFLFPREAAILADEMGLGKTMQAITSIRMLLLSGEMRSVLLICPKPLVTNWVREFKLWAPEVPVAVIEGDPAKREWIWSHPQAPVKIANYELLMRDREMIDQGSLGFDLVVLDEAQRIKNRNSTTSEIVRSIDRQRSWALTGTPIENSTDDLVSIFEFLSPGYLHDGMDIKSMSQASRDFILRRTKSQVLSDMPPKLFRDAELDLSPEQWATYRGAEDEGVLQLSDLGESLTIQHVFKLVLRLKQICNFDPATNASSKMERLEADLEEVAASGQKAIVFSQWVDTLDKISERVERFNPLHYHGRIPSHRRDDVIRRFKEDPKHTVILMSYGAGAVGLNLQFCHYVFLFDRWWNPAVEDQAINRAHRLGVKQTVTVTRMMAMNTVEERIHRVLEEKRELINTLFAEASKPTGLGLSQKEIFGLFNLTIPHKSPRAA